MLEYLSHHTKQNSVVADHLWNLDCPKHHRLYAPYAFERVYNTNSCSGNHQINADVGNCPRHKKTQLNGWVHLVLLKQLLSEACLQRR